jgi:hypothetical protein
LGPVVPVAFIAVALAAVMFCCAKAVSLPMTDKNPNRSAAATNIPAIGIAAIALDVILLLLYLVYYLDSLMRMRGYET